MNIPPEIESIACNAAVDPNKMKELLDFLAPENKAADRRGESFQALLWLCQNQPHLVYSHWDYFQSILNSDNSFALFNAVYIIAAIIDFDSERKFDGIYDRFMNLLNHRTMMVSAHTALNLGKIAKSRPDLEPMITAALLDIDANPRDPERLEILKGYIIEAFKEYYPLAQSRRAIRIFVEKQLKCNNLKTRNLAHNFLRMAGEVSEFGREM